MRETPACRGPCGNGHHRLDADLRPRRCEHRRRGACVSAARREAHFAGICCPSGRTRHRSLDAPHVRCGSDLNGPVGADSHAVRSQAGPDGSAYSAGANGQPNGCLRCSAFETRGRPRDTKLTRATCGRRVSGSTTGYRRVPSSPQLGSTFVPLTWVFTAVRTRRSNPATSTGNAGPSQQLLCS